MSNQKDFEKLSERELKSNLNSLYLEKSVHLTQPVVKQEYLESINQKIAHTQNNSDLECCICLETLKNGYVMNCCSQKIHDFCLKRWCRNDYENKQLSNCPMCMSKFNNKDLFEVSLFTRLKNLFCECDTRKKR